MNGIRLGAALLNGADAVFERFGVHLPALNLDGLLAKAKRRTGLDDFGDERFREGLSRLLHAYDHEARLSGFGRMAAYHDVLRVLCNRLRLQEDRRRFPAIGEQNVKEPVFVLGLPRSGTTVLHKLLACDPQFRAPLSWEMLWPSPPPGEAQSDERLRSRAESQIGLLYQLAPEFRRIHLSAAGEPEECLLIMAHSFQSYQFQTTHRVPGYQRWLESQDLLWSYSEHRAFLQQLQMHRPGSRWLLKAPAHLYGLESLLRVYPDARIVFLHRNPLEALASTVSMHVTLRRVFSREVDPAEVAREMSARWIEGLMRALGARDSGRVSAANWADIHYQSFVANPLATVENLYERLGLRLDDVARERMQTYLSQRPKDRYGVHEYKTSTVDFVAGASGLSAYRERFAV